MSIAPSSENSSRETTPVELKTGGETVLLVDDDDFVRELAQEIMEMNGYSVLTAKTGRIALQLFAEYNNSVHMLITDVSMPIMSGAELAERLRELRSNLKILFTSGYPDHTIKIAPDFFISKPYSAASLARKVREVLDVPPTNTRAVLT